MAPDVNAREKVARPDRADVGGGPPAQRAVAISSSAAKADVNARALAK